MKRLRFIFLGIAFSLGPYLNYAMSEDKRPTKWAAPLKIVDVPNRHKVADRRYRCAQPTATRMKNLKALGGETVVNLHPEEKEIVRFLQIVTNPKRTPVLVHCQHGADKRARCA